MRNLESRIPGLIEELKLLANGLTMYDLYSCEYIDRLSDVNYSVLKRAWRKADNRGDLSLSRFVNKLLKGKVIKSKVIV
jgi:hypothetical protein